MAKHVNLVVDDGVEPDEDNYFSPLKYKHEHDNHSTISKTDEG